MTLLTSFPLPHYTFSEFSGSHFLGQFPCHFCSPGRYQPQRSFSKAQQCDLSASYLCGTVKVVLAAIWKVRKFSMEKCTPEARQPGHKQACETQPTLIFLNGTMSKCGLVKDRSERVSKVNGFLRGRKIPSVWRTAPRAPWPNERDTYKEMRSLQQVKECRHCWRG